MREKNKVAHCTFSTHELEVDFGIEILSTVNVGEDQLGSPVLLLVPSEDIATHYINNRMAQ